MPTSEQLHPMGTLKAGVARLDILATGDFFQQKINMIKIEYFVVFI